MKSSKLINYSIGRYCQKFRQEELLMNCFKLGIAIPELERSTRNVQSFETGNSSNIAYLLLYYKNCTTEEQRAKFIAGLRETFIQIIESEDMNNE